MPRYGRGGWIRSLHTIPSVSNAAANPHFSGTGAITLVDSQTPGFQLTFEQFGFCASITAGATAGSQVFKLRKGGASGTVIATLTLALANVNALGEVTTANVSGTFADCTLDDDDTFSITRDASGTDYTTEPEGHFFVKFRQRPQLDA
jgi:hypothetical protein